MWHCVSQTGSVWRGIGCALFALSACAEGPLSSFESEAALVRTADTEAASRVAQNLMPPGLEFTRQDPGALALDENRLLVCGGLTEGRIPGDNPSCEILDVKSGARTLAPALPSGRRFMTLTLLSAPGEPWSVLMVGGLETFGSVPNALLGSEQGWVEEPIVPRQYHTSSLLSDGSLLVVGGDDLGPLVSEVSLRSPDGAWSTAGIQERTLHAAVNVNGGVLAIGGFDANRDGLASVALFSEASGEWALREPLPEARGLHTATVLEDGSVLVVGGASSESAPPWATAWRYSVETDEWEPANGGVPLVPRMEHRASRLGRYVVVVGGFNLDEELIPIVLDSIQVYDPLTNSWADLAPLDQARRRFALTAHGARLVAVAGTNNQTDFSSVELIEPLALGSPAERGQDCVSGHVADGVCCETACSGTCRSCSVEPGTCTDLESGPPAAGRGSCDNGFVCAAGECADRCGDDTGCAEGHFCTEGVCESKKDRGAECGRPEECAAGLHCTDGKCCNEACEGTCEFCNSDGFCQARLGAPLAPRPACAVEGHADCVATCDGISRTECTFPDESKACGEAQCEAGQEIRAGVCDAEGQCTQEQVACEGFACGEVACLRSCEDEDDCALGFYCEGRRCVPECETASDCGPSQACLEGRCVAPLCDPERRRELGTNKDCGEFVCDWRSGLCKTTCDSNWDCAPGRYCDGKGSCFEPPILSGRLDGCSLSRPAGGRFSASGLAVLLAGLVAVGRRSGRGRRIESGSRR